MAFCIPQPSSGGWDRQPDAMLLRWSLADPVASLLQTGRSKRSFCLVPTDLRPPSSDLRPPSSAACYLSDSRCPKTA